jgi:endonuclease YncB( thermonuclease family)
MFLSRLFLVLALLHSPAWADVIKGKVVRVSDGDTIVVLDAQKVQHKIRLAGIDAPESKQAFGQVSKQGLADLVANKTVTVETNKIDRYGRQVGKVLLGKQDVCLSQLELGLAWFFRQYQNELSDADRKLYEDAEATAKDLKLGLWRDPAPTPPWEFRREKR